MAFIFQSIWNNSRAERKRNEKRKLLILNAKINDAKIHICIEDLIWLCKTCDREICNSPKKKPDGKECKLNEKDTSNCNQNAIKTLCVERKFVYLVYFSFISLVFFATISFSSIKRILKTHTYILPFCLITTMWKHSMHLENENGCYGTRVGHWTLQPHRKHQSRAYRASSNQSKQNWIDRLNFISLCLSSSHFLSYSFIHSFALCCCYCFHFFLLLQTHVDWMAFGLYSFSVLYGNDDVLV